MAAAAEALGRALTLDPTDRHAGLFLAMTHQRRGDAARARSQYEKTVRIVDERYPADMQVRRTRSEAIAMLGVKDSSNGKVERRPPEAETELK